MLAAHRDGSARSGVGGDPEGSGQGSCAGSGVGVADVASFVWGTALAAVGGVGGPGVALESGLLTQAEASADKKATARANVVRDRRAGSLCLLSIVSSLSHGLRPGNPMPASRVGAIASKGHLTWRLLDVYS